VLRVRDPFRMFHLWTPSHERRAIVPPTSPSTRRAKIHARQTLVVTGMRLTVDRYDPEVAPVAEDWLTLDEGERIQLVEEYHRDARIPLPKRARSLHASMHVVVENQLASNDEPVVRALARLMKEGLSTHDAVHAIGSLVAEEVYDLLKQAEPPDTVRARYYAAVERLTAGGWRTGGGD
jgi:uncharacterized protein DUF1841